MEAERGQLITKIRIQQLEIEDLKRSYQELWEIKCAAQADLAKQLAKGTSQAPVLTGQMSLW